MLFTSHYSAVIVVLCFAASTSAATRIEHRQPFFTIEIPDGFQQAQSQPSPNLLYLFGTAPGDTPSMVISIQDLGGRIGLERLTKSDISNGALPGYKLDIEYQSLMGTEINVLVFRRTKEGFQLFTLGAQIPLTQRGIQINVSGLAEQEGEIREELHNLLMSFEGELITSRLPSGQLVTVRKIPAGERIFTLIWSALAIVGWLALPVYGLFRLMLIGRPLSCLRVRRICLATCGICLLFSSVLRVIHAQHFHDQTQWLYALIGIAVAALVLNAHRRLSKVFIPSPSPSDENDMGTIT